MLSDKHREEEVEPSPFDGLQKNAVLHEARVFHERELDPSQCRAVLTRLLFLLSRGEEFVSREATEVFFGVTKLFQSPDVDLRRLIYLMIKELSACVGTDESLIVVQCLSKDMAGTTALFRANAIRVLAKIIDGTMLGQIERFMKQAIVDKETFVSSSAIVAGLHLYEVAPDVVKRWGNEVQEVLKSGSAMAQYHAMLLLHKIKQTDRMAVNKMVSSFVRTSPRGYMAQVLLVRYIANVLARQNPPDRDLHRHLVDFLRDKDEVVMFEAARAICLLPSLPPAMLAPAIETLRHDFLNSDSIYRFAGVRLLSQVVARYPQAVAPCSPELERLLTDANRNVATLAITCLLKTGVEASVDRLMKSLSGFMNEISEEFKVVLVDAVKTLCLKFPHKHGTLMAFLSTSLREEGGAAYKRALVYAMLDLISNIEAAKEHGLDHFCEFIEDCEYLDLSIKILHLLGEEGPKTSNPARYIRFIFNRIILEAAPVRAAAVSSLAKFGAAVPALTDQVIVLLERAKEDNDDEVRDRVVFYLDRLTKDRQAALNSVQPLPVNVRTLEHSLRLYLASPDATAQPFNLDAHVVELEDDEDDIAAATDGAAAGSGDNALAAAIAGTGMVVANPYLDVLNSIPEFAEFGELFKSCKPVALTEEEAEYRVSCVKHIYAEHVVFQFLVRNNLDIMQLENINVSIDADEDAGWHEALEVSEPVLTYGAEGSCFVALARPGDSFASDPMPTTLNFTAKEVDVDSGEVEEDGLEDSYELEDVEVTEQDFVTHGEHMGLVKFRAEWEALGNTHEARKKYSLGLEDLQGAVDAVIGLLGMQACEDSGTVPEDKRSHAVNLYGLFVGNVPVFARAGFQLDPRHGVSLRLAVRSSNPEIGTLMVNAIR